MAPSTLSRSPPPPPRRSILCFFVRWCVSVGACHRSFWSFVFSALGAACADGVALFVLCINRHTPPSETRVGRGTDPKNHAQPTGRCRHHPLETASLCQQGKRAREMKSTASSLERAKHSSLSPAAVPGNQSAAAAQRVEQHTANTPNTPNTAQNSTASSGQPRTRRRGPPRRATGVH